MTDHVLTKRRNAVSGHFEKYYKTYGYGPSRAGGYLIRNQQVGGSSPLTGTNQKEGSSRDSSSR